MAYLGFIHVPERPISVRTALTCLNLVVGMLFLRRTGLHCRLTLSSAMHALPSMVLAGAAVHSVAGWPWWTQGVFVAGAAWTIVSLATLGRSFALFPVSRALVVRGPYRLVRHPAYLGEGVMVAAAGLAAPWPAGILAALGVLALHLRIREEERVLTAEPAHPDYRTAVRWRLVPGIY